MHGAPRVTWRQVAANGSVETSMLPVGHHSIKIIAVETKSSDDGNGDVIISYCLLEGY
jgi:hypothetical protein